MNDNKNEFIIREAARNDVPAIREIFSYYIINTTATWRYKTPDLNWMYSWFDQHQESGKPVLVVEIDNNIIGYASLSDYRAGEGYWPCAENSIYIMPDYCDHGIGRRLMMQLIELAKKSDLRFLIAGIDAENKSSIRFHESFGFKTNTVMKKIGNKFNRSLDLTLMILEL